MGNRSQCLSLHTHKHISLSLSKLCSTEYIILHWHLDTCVIHLLRHMQTHTHACTHTHTCTRTYTQRKLNRKWETQKGHLMTLKLSLNLPSPAYEYDCLCNFCYDCPKCCYHVNQTEFFFSSSSFCLKYKSIMYYFLVRQTLFQRDDFHWRRQIVVQICVLQSYLHLGVGSDVQVEAEVVQCSATFCDVQGVRKLGLETNIQCIIINTTASHFQVK